MHVSDTLKTACAWIGIAAVCGGVVILAWYMVDAFVELIRLWRWELTYKHRFDKPPTAACYCKDCKYHGMKFPDGANPCNFPGVDRWTPADGFCYEAEPIAMKEAKKRETC